MIHEQSSPDGCVEVFLIIAKRVLADQENSLGRGVPAQTGTLRESREARKCHWFDSGKEMSLKT